MACSASTCQSNCYRDQPQEEEEDAKHTNANSIATNTISSNNRNNSHGLCLKCKANPPISADTHADDSRFCADCFRANLFGKFRFAVTSNAMISPTDNVLVAFSGGPSSRVALQFVHEMGWESWSHESPSMFTIQGNRSFQELKYAAVLYGDEQDCFAFSWG